MKRITILFTLLIIGLTISYGQNPSDSISTKKVFGGYQFYQGEQILNMNQLANIIKPNEQAYKQIKSARLINTTTMILSYAGGFMIGWPIGTAIAGGDPSWIMAGIGAGLIAVAIPISMSSGKKAKQAVDIFNGGLKTSSFWDKNELELTMVGKENGIGLRLNF
ncbi:MAG: hypothetical protein ACK5KP_01325 [Paludibacteraceae bacterium]